MVALFTFIKKNYADVTSKASMDSSVPNIAGAALGGVFGIIFFAVAMCVVCSLLFFVFGIYVIVIV